MKKVANTVNEKIEIKNRIRISEAIAIYKWYNNSNYYNEQKGQFRLQFLKRCEIFNFNDFSRKPLNNST